MKSLQWQTAIRGYVWFPAGKVVEIIYGATLAADFLRPIR
jgi:hypothetical protein